MDLKVPMNPGIAKLLAANPVEGLFINLGRADIQEVINMVGRSGLLAAWNHKWDDMFIRPEAYSIEVERVFRDKRNKYGISPELLKNPVIQALQSRNGNALLQQAYSEGSPLHPSTPSGHATIAGACVTVLKFFFNAKHELDIYEPDQDGQNLLNTGKKTIVGDELDKLASNIGIGRNWAGIHYHMDAIQGMKLGEKVAISCLSDLIHRYPVKLSISLTKFSGKEVTLSN
jgi:membrane-associated phospholipid phosphatase